MPQCPAHVRRATDSRRRYDSAVSSSTVSRLNSALNVQFARRAVALRVHRLIEHLRITNSEVFTKLGQLQGTSFIVSQYGCEHSV
jgi:hypothetical protein